MNSKRIEENAVIAFQDYLDECTHISQFVDANDKTPFWDGEILLYKDTDWEKEQFVDSIPVQVKGKIVKEFVKDRFRYSIKVADLKAYKKKATLYIVCQLKEKGNGLERLLFYNLYYQRMSKRSCQAKTDLNQSVFL